ncbi:Sulfur carrier protein adenylyltransferase ThiF [Caenispirillum salinarum AK4]|uniref:Molybdopterin-synthase adenylyltransferase n=1 Tax=Caenispirillum salinarum AK4 TaxID=1238182 RepID=K9H4F5_9PROT|nr:molybdopterin-synthase adenylyltransferase MoeB [Caenispirillum salinarum]EKV31969.1 Sulfur carrier protein adenylyltransferase ThiF [Caenispirillum salinarum AK4]
MDFTDEQINRYARHIILREVGGAGQEALLNARVLLIGAGGLGSPMGLYLAAAGVGTLGIVDDDTVDLSNLQRQVMHDSGSVGVPKVDSAAARLRALNPDVTVVPHKTRLTADNALDLIDGYDIVADGSDNFETRFLVNDACHLAGKTLVSGAILRFDGQVSTFATHRGGPCYRCIYGDIPPAGSAPTCAQAGVLGAVPGVVGSLQATEVLKEILGVGESLSGRLMIWDALAAEVRTVRVPRDPGCALCGDAPTITDLSRHAR